VIKVIAKRLARKLLHNEVARTARYCLILEQLYAGTSDFSADQTSPATLSIIIFSKDRAIQLHALLASFYELVKGAAVIKVLYTASSPEHKQAYEKLKSLFAEKAIEFRLETNFREDLLDTLDHVTTEMLMFLVDDIVFTEPLDLSELTSYKTSCFVPSLRLGEHLSYSYTMRMQQPLPAFRHDVLPDSDLLVWKWQDGQLDWAYPLSVDGHLFNTREIRTIIRNLDFKAPNSLEESMQLMNPIFTNRYGLANRKSSILNIPNNKVQQENDNHAGDMSTAFLLKKWEEGYQINFRKLRHFKNESAHQEVDLEFVKLETGI
jgi:hypothetical protein